MTAFFMEWWKYSKIDYDNGCATQNILKAVKLYTLNGWIVRYLSYSSIKLLTSTSHYYSVFLFLVFFKALNYHMTYSVLSIYLANVYSPYSNINSNMEGSLFCSYYMYLQCLEQCLEYSRYLANIANWENEWNLRLPIIFHTCLFMK